MARHRADATRALTRHLSGDSRAADALLPLIYNKLRALARQYLRGERAGNTLQPTALVHESYMRMYKDGDLSEDSAQFLAYAATAMRRILIERARRIRTLRHGGDRSRVPLSHVTITEKAAPLEIVELDDALQRLTRINSGYGDVVMLRFLLGRSVEETARALHCSTAKVKKDSRFARVWLRVELGV